MIVAASCVVLVWRCCCRCWRIALAGVVASVVLVSVVVVVVGDCTSAAFEEDAPPVVVVEEGKATVFPCPSMVNEVSILMTIGARVISSSTSSSSNSGIGIGREVFLVVLGAYGGGGAGREACLWRLARISASLWLWCARGSDGGSIFLDMDEIVCS